MSQLKNTCFPGSDIIKNISLIGGTNEKGKPKNE